MRPFLVLHRSGEAVISLVNHEWAKPLNSGPRRRRSRDLIHLEMGDPDGGLTAARSQGRYRLVILKTPQKLPDGVIPRASLG